MTSLPCFRAAVILTVLSVSTFGSLRLLGAQPKQPHTAEPAKTGQSELQTDAAVVRRLIANRISIPDFPRDVEWLNTSGPLRQQDLQGKFILLDFWTYCCINCLHVLPELKKLEQKYANELVVIGVHSAKFETEKDSENIAEAILRYGIEHPVVNDANHRIWNMFQVRSWPTLILIDPQGYAIGRRSGEFEAKELDAVLSHVIPYYRQLGVLDETPLRFQLLKYNQPETPLRFPGKVLVDARTERLFIADSGHNRIVIARLDGTLVDAIGSGAVGKEDGDYASASFSHPQGMALWREALYLADTENHVLRCVDLRDKQVTTVAGTGEQSRNPWPGFEGYGSANLPKRFVGPPETTPLNSPWALCIHSDQLYIAMAGPHQIWKMPLDASEIGPYAGNGREDIVDGRLLPRQPYDDSRQYSAFAQPSGLASDGTWLYVADSEGSSIRAVPFDPGRRVRTVVGTANKAVNRLFLFGDRDGPASSALLQHPLDVAYHDGQIYVADTYNNKIRSVDATSGYTRTLVGTSTPGYDDRRGLFDEPAGLAYAEGRLYVADTNNHKIRVVNLADRRVSTLEIRGLQPPQVEQQQATPRIAGAAKVALESHRVRARDDRIQLDVNLKLPAGWKINPLAPLRYTVALQSEHGPIDRKARGGSIDPPKEDFSIQLPVTGEGEETLRLELTYYYCQEGNEGLCKIGQVIWTLPLSVTHGSASPTVNLSHEVGP